MLYTATYAPYRTAFMYNDASFFLFAFETMTDLIFLADIFITFISATERVDGSYETTLKRLARNYIFGFLFIDLCSVFPTQIFEAIGDPVEP